MSDKDKQYGDLLSRNSAREDYGMIYPIPQNLIPFNNLGPIIYYILFIHQYSFEFIFSTGTMSRDSRLVGV